MRMWIEPFQNSVTTGIGYRQVQQFSTAPQAVGARNKCAPRPRDDLHSASLFVRVLFSPTLSVGLLPLRSYCLLLGICVQDLSCNRTRTCCCLNLVSGTEIPMRPARKRTGTSCDPKIGCHTWEPAQTASPKSLEIQLERDTHDYTDEVKGSCPYSLHSCCTDACNRAACFECSPAVAFLTRSHDTVISTCLHPYSGRYDRRVVRGNTYAAVVQPEPDMAEV